MVRAAVNRLLLSRRLFYLTTERDDLYQIGWLALHNCKKTYDESRGVKFDTYATKAVRNAVNNELWRLSKRRMYPIAAEADFVYIPNIKDREMDRVTKAVESTHFSKQERTIFWLRFTEEEHYDVIGKRIGLSREGVRRMYHKSLSKLKELMANE